MSKNPAEKIDAKNTAIRNILSHAYEDARYFRNEEKEATAKAIEAIAKHLESHYKTWIV